MGKGDIHMTGFWKRLWRRNSTESSDENATTCFGPGVEIEGKINVSAGTIRVNTRVKGEISSNGSIEVGPRGELEATVRAKAVIVAGNVGGAPGINTYFDLINLWVTELARAFGAPGAATQQ